MNNDTKRDVFEKALRDWDDLVHRWGLQGEEAQGRCEFDPILIKYEKEYDAALPDNLPVIPKEVGEYLKRYKLMFTLFGFLRDAVSRIDTPLDDLNQTKYHWIVKNQNTFAIAWLLGVWRVEGTGEIVKLEEEK